MTTDTESPKLRAALAAADLVESGMIVGLGSGSTAALMVRRIGERVEQEKLKIIAVATSVATAELARSLKIPVLELDDVAALDINLDGADEIDPHFQMIKGRGGALLREKIVATASRAPGHHDHRRQTRAAAGHDHADPRGGQSDRCETHRAQAADSSAPPRRSATCPMALRT